MEFQENPKAFNLSSDSSLITEIEIVNMVGQQILQTQVNARDFQIDLSAYSKGFYFLRSHTEEGMSVHKLILK